MRVITIATFLIVLCPLAAADAATHRHAKHGSSSSTPALTLESVNTAAPQGAGNDPALIVKTEVLLDRHGFSPGEIDGKDGDNYRKALVAFQQAKNVAASGKIDADTWNALLSDNADPPLTSYTISEREVAGPFDKRIPSELEKKSELPGLSYKTSQEELAEKFHMSQDLLRRLNPHASFERAGEEIVVANVEPMALHDSRDTVKAAPPKKQNRQNASVATIVVEKASRDVRAYDKDGTLLRFYPATIGSSDKPAPSGTFEVRRVAYNPDYHYNPKFAWKGVEAKEPLTIKAGPNNPVGLVWIDLTAPSYGIHGTPEPEKIGKTESHGCIRLTNWDALDLAGMVHKGTMVKFADTDSAAGTQATK
jgi:lipoprotein-anchoring transpeptidase ErfK/SrfK